MIDTKIVQGGVARPPTRRTSSRDSLFLSATIQRVDDALGEPMSVRVRNLSAIGLMADYNGVAVPGEPVIVTVRGIGSVAGKVAWIKKGRVGVNFDVEVDPLMARKPLGRRAP
ncbi:PilZ domain-containing protein [Allosphingosinicella sp.]|uniref:PilZ domain-containing protein n=1 Tax=Allosphingosinicella sp. TaxID=2823234 RepID=UPI002FC17B03